MTPQRETGPAPAGGLVGVIDRIRETAKRNGERVSLETVLQGLGVRSYGPILLVPSLLALIPIIGAIPGMSVLTSGGVLTAGV